MPFTDIDWSSITRPSHAPRMRGVKRAPMTSLDWSGVRRSSPSSLEFNFARPRNISPSQPRVARDSITSPSTYANMRSDYEATKRGVRRARVLAIAFQAGVGAARKGHDVSFARQVQPEKRAAWLAGYRAVQAAQRARLGAGRAWGFIKEKFARGR